MEFYAIGYKGWVEVRKASTPPRRKMSHITLPYRRYRTRWNDNMHMGLGGYETIIDIVKKKIDVSVYVGGSVVATVPTTLVRNRIGLTIPNGAMAHLLPEQKDALLADTANAVTI